MPLLCGCFSLNGWTERRGTCAHGTSDPVCICVCVPYCHRMLLIQQLWICCIYAVCLNWCWFFWLCSSAVQRCSGLCKWMGQVVRTFDQNEKGRGVRMTGIRCLRGQAAVISWDMPLEMELFPSYCFNGLKQHEWEKDSHGCFKERDKENRKQERREEKYCREVAGSKQGACCQ